MSDNPYITVASPNYAVPLVNWFGQSSGNGGQKRTGTAAAPTAVGSRAATPAQAAQPTQGLGTWLRQQFGLGPQPVNALGQNPAQGGIGLPMTIAPLQPGGPAGNPTGSLY
jgi:hypothetical protein